MNNIDYHDPFQVLLRVFAAEWPEARVRVQFDANEHEGGQIPDGKLGYTAMDEDPPVVRVWVGCPVEGGVDIMAHELAHVVAGSAAGHGPEWRAAYNRLNLLFCEAMGSRQREWSPEEMARLQKSAEPKGQDLTIATAERVAIMRAMRHANGCKRQAARLLGVGKTTLYRKLLEYGLHEPKRRAS